MTFKAYAKLEKKPGFTLIEKKIDSNLNPHEVLIKVYRFLYVELMFIFIIGTIGPKKG